MQRGSLRVKEFGERNCYRMVGDELGNDPYGFIIIHGIKLEQLSGFSEDDLSG